jgi:OFA family oxalate/formate antiporter-like MFS transporter
LLYLAAAIGGVIYGASVGNALKWFPDRRGLAAGLTAAGFGGAPEAGEVTAPAAAAVLQSRRDYGPVEVLKTAPFWVMYVMFVMVGTGGLMATAQLAPIAKDLRSMPFRSRSWG